MAPRSREKSSFLFFHRRHTKTKEPRQPLLLPLPLSTTPSIIDGQGAFTISSSLAAKTIKSINHQLSSSSQARKTKALKIQKASGLALAGKAESWPSSFVSHHPSCSLFFFNHRLARRHHSEAKKAKRKQISSSIVKRKGIKNNALSQ